MCLRLVQCTTILTRLLHLVSTLEATQACCGCMFHCLHVDSGYQVATLQLPTRDTGIGGLAKAPTFAERPVSPYRLHSFKSKVHTSVSLQIAVTVCFAP